MSSMTSAEEAVRGWIAHVPIRDRQDYPARAYMPSASATARSPASLITLCHGGFLSLLAEPSSPSTISSATWHHASSGKSPQTPSEVPFRANPGSPPDVAFPVSHSGTGCLCLAILPCTQWRRRFIRHTYNISFLPSSVAGHLGRSHVLAIGNNATVNTGVQISLGDSAFIFFRSIPGSGDWYTQMCTQF